MNRSWKKWISCVSALSLAVGVGACSSADKGDDTSASHSSGATTAAQSGKFRMFASDFNAAYPATASKDFPAIKYMAEKTNVDLDLVLIPHGQYAEQLRIKFASGDIPDVYQTWSIADSEPVQNGLAMELNDLIDKYGPNLKARIPKSTWDAVTINGKIMAIPSPPNANAPAERVLYVRKDWMDKLGLKEPKTSDELLNVLRAFKEKDPNGNGLADEIPLSSREKFTWLDNIFGMWGVNLSDFSLYNNEIIPGFVHPNTKKALEFIRTLYAEKLLDSEFLSNNATTWKQKILADKVGMFNHNQTTGGSWYRDLRDSLKSNKNVDIMAIPTPKGSGYDGPVGRVEQPLGKTFIIFKQSKNAEAVVKFFDWLVTDEGNFFATYGFEGEALIRQGNELTYEVGKEKNFQSVWRYSIFDIIDLDSVSSQIKGDAEIDTRAKQAIEVSKKEGIPNPVAAMPIPKSLLSQSDLNWNGSLFQEAAAKIIVGDKPLEYFDEFVSIWKKQGGDSIIKEATEWYYKNVKGQSNNPK